MLVNTAGIKGFQNTLQSPGTGVINYRSNCALGKQNCSGAGIYSVGREMIEMFSWINPSRFFRPLIFRTEAALVYILIHKVK